MIKCFHEKPVPDYTLFPGHREDSNLGQWKWNRAILCKAYWSWPNLNLCGPQFPHLKTEATISDYLPRLLKRLNDTLKIKQCAWQRLSVHKCTLSSLLLLVFQCLSSVCCKDINITSQDS